MIAVLKALLAENRKRSSEDQIVFRPDHGHRMLDDLAETEAHQSRLYRHRPAARAGRTARRHPRHRTTPADFAYPGIRYLLGRLEGRQPFG